MYGSASRPDRSLEELETELELPPHKNGSKSRLFLVWSAVGAAAIISVFFLTFGKFSLAGVMPAASSFSSSEISKSVAKLTSLKSSKSSLPHIVYILIDDLGYNSLGDDDNDFYGIYPNMKSLMDEGVVIENYYAQEVCTPSRAALLTGRYPLTLGMQYGMVDIDDAFGLNLEETLLSEVLKDNGYATHILGKWHLGNMSPRYLPTARGFESFTGYLGGEEYYWSKKAKNHETFHDFLTATETCYYPYQEDDKHTYSTYFYRDKAIELIESHNSSESFFLYLALQAVHDPFSDVNKYDSGVPKEYLDDDIYDLIKSNVKGRKRRQQAMALNIADSAIGDIVDALDDADMLSDSIIVIASDNGGCYDAGGRNGGLRGTKGSLFEGGIRVESFVYSELFSDDMKGMTYSNLFHVSDWFPTLLDMANINFTAESGYELDGVSHYTAMQDSTTSSPRSYVLYNYYYDVEGYDFDMWTNGSFGVRNDRYKLLHAYEGSAYSSWTETDDIEDDDSNLDLCNQCKQDITGYFSYYFFDLQEDPTETTNLYYSDNSTYEAIKNELYSQLDIYAANSRTVEITSTNMMAQVVWKENDNTVVPFEKTEDLEEYSGTYPENCYDSE